MKRFLISFSGIVSVILFFSCCYYISFHNTVRKLEDKKVEQKPEMQELIEDNRKLQETPLPVEAVTAEETIITSDTLCVYEIVKIDTGERYQYEAQPTSDIAGLTREQLQKRLRNYVATMSVMEYEAGLLSYELVSFSPERVVMQKVYDGSKIKYKYYVTVKNDEVIVLYSDKKTIFEYTGITRQTLSDDIWNALIPGIPVKDVEELYDYLSGITS